MHHCPLSFFHCTPHNCESPHNKWWPLKISVGWMCVFTWLAAVTLGLHCQRLVACDCSLCVDALLNDNQSKQVPFVCSWQPRWVQTNGALKKQSSMLALMLTTLWPGFSRFPCKKQGLGWFHPANHCRVFASDFLEEPASSDSLVDWASQTGEPTLGTKCPWMVALVGWSSTS